MSVSDRQSGECSEQGEMRRTVWMECHKSLNEGDKNFAVSAHPSRLLLDLPGFRWGMPKFISPLSPPVLLYFVSHSTG